MPIFIIFSRMRGVVELSTGFEEVLMGGVLGAVNRLSDNLFDSTHIIGQVSCGKLALNNDLRKCVW